MRLATSRIPSLGKPTPHFASTQSKYSNHGLNLFIYRQKHNWNGNYGRPRIVTPQLPITKLCEVTPISTGRGNGLKWICLGAALLFAPFEERQELSQPQQNQHKQEEEEQNHSSAGNLSVMPPQRSSFKDLFVHSSLGTAVGFAVGYAARKSLKLLFVLVGSQFVMLQILQHLGYIEIKWGKVAEKAEEKWENERHQMWNSMKAILTENVPFKGGFLAGMAWGFHFPV